MMNSLWNSLKRIFGMDGSWETMTLTRVGIDPASARFLTRVLQPVHTVRLRPAAIDVVGGPPRPRPCRFPKSARA